jgi:hypothetical protein
MCWQVIRNAGTGAPMKSPLAWCAMQDVVRTSRPARALAPLPAMTQGFFYRRRTGKEGLEAEPAASQA